MSKPRAEPRWLTVKMLRAIHAEAISGFGGAPGVRDESLLESALDRPRNHFAYRDDASLYGLAAAYCAGIVGNHPFVDGNKRAGIVAAATFLALNGYRLAPPETEVVMIIEALAAGGLGEEELTQWFSDYSVKEP